jgi:hypothetical protein
MKSDTDVCAFVKGSISVESLDGETYSGNTYAEVVGEMRATAWGGLESDGIRGYMKQVAKRIYDWSNKRIRIGTPEMFLKDMAKEGLIRLSGEPT